MSTTSDRIIEIEVTAEDVAQMRSDGVPENELPAVGPKRYRAARHIMRDKVAILLDTDIVEHFKRKAASDDAEFYQTDINQTLRHAIESQR